MENSNPNPNPNPNSTPSSAHHHQHNNSSANLKRFFKSDSNKSNRSVSMSDNESQASHMDSFHSPLCSDSPLHSDDPIFNSASNSNSNSDSKAIVSVDKYFSPYRSPKKAPSVTSSFSATPVTSGLTSPPVMVLNRSMKDGVPPGVEKLETGHGEDEVGRESRSRAAVKKAALGFRICEVILCLIAFSVMAADKTQGWSGDSFDRYKEYRYLVAVNVIGFAYSGFQACCLAYYLATGNNVISSPFRYFFDFSIDQMLAYLLMSASSSAATRVDDWVSNWGKDDFTEMATASISMSFLAFFAFALSSLICGYSLCNRESTIIHN